MARGIVIKKQLYPATFFDDKPLYKRFLLGEISYEEVPQEQIIHTIKWGTHGDYLAACKETGYLCDRPQITYKPTPQRANTSNQLSTKTEEPKREKSPCFMAKKLKPGERIIEFELALTPCQISQVNRTWDYCNRMIAYALKVCSINNKAKGDSISSNQMTGLVPIAKQEIPGLSTVDSSALKWVMIKLSQQLSAVSKGDIDKVWVPGSDTNISYITDQPPLQKKAKNKFLRTGKLDLPYLRECVVKNKSSARSKLMNSGRIMAALIEWNNEKKCWIAKVKYTMHRLSGQVKRKNVRAYKVVAIHRHSRRFLGTGVASEVLSESVVVARSRNEAINAMIKLHPAYKNCSFRVFFVGDTERENKYLTIARGAFNYRTGAMVLKHFGNTVVEAVEAKLQHIVDSVWADLNYRRDRYCEFLFEVQSADNKWFKDKVTRPEFADIREYEKKYQLA